MSLKYLKELIFVGKTFCCCLPVRFGLISMSFLGILFGGMLSIVCWFEVTTTTSNMEGMKAALVVGGLVETILFMASTLGFIGAIVRKQSFVQTYAYILYVHFLLNLGVAIYLLVVITNFSSAAITNACEDTVKNTAAQEQCGGLFKSARRIIIGISAVVLFVEMYGAIIAARYVNQIKGEKRAVRSSRIQAAEEYEIQMKNRNSRLSHNSPPPDFSRDFSPYEVTKVHHDRRSTAGSTHNYQSVPLDGEAEGYSGATLTHEQLAEEGRLDEAVVANPFLDNEEIERDVTPHQPSRPTHDIDAPPKYRYTLSDPP